MASPVILKYTWSPNKTLALSSSFGDSDVGDVNPSAKGDLMNKSTGLSSPGILYGSMTLLSYCSYI